MSAPLSRFSPPPRPRAMFLALAFAILLIGFPSSAVARKRKGKYKGMKGKRLKGKCAKDLAVLGREMEANSGLSYDLVTSADGRGRTQVLARCTSDGTVIFKGNCIKKKFRYHVPGSKLEPPMKQLTPKRLGKTVDVVAADTCATTTTAGSSSTGWEVYTSGGASCTDTCVYYGLPCQAQPLADLGALSESDATVAMNLILSEVNGDGFGTAFGTAADPLSAPYLHLSDLSPQIQVQQGGTPTCDAVPTDQTFYR
eukprot:UC1_evm1s330